ncbi:MAG: hypothetical protein KAF24_03170 [Nitrosopumilaceae archaeon]|nr:hypothetical protein [Nitrosopumilaceae archaeon]
MQYFTALKIGQKRIELARKYLNNISNSTLALPALALKEKLNVWMPVGEKNFYAIIDESSGYVLSNSSGAIITLCDEDGISKTLIQGINHKQKTEYVNALKKDKIPKFHGKVQLPV